ncbi:R3H domain-containing protein 1 [Impatiens glandulifera]|uniref:R3H domain-containing protein 1 n=1 Tax=Impatiens glandulifera TaxID=253017 RepID=UPI001FB19DBD|nr:R3H domain-containing protein 1 [Impatiens glandulifera]
MDSLPSTTKDEGSALLQDTDACAAPLVDPFLVEALQNPRHRLTILRMELDIQKFLQNSDVEQFEFQQFPTSYLRLAAHRVAQHYGLQTMVQDSALDGQGTKIVVRKTTESRCSAMHLSDIPIRQLGTEKHDNVKIFLRPKPFNASNEASELGMKRSTVRTVEERKEDYDRARARIFSSPTNSELEDTISQAPIEGKVLCMTTEPERSISVRDVGMPSLVATFKDRDKDLTDPDYDRRSYKRYVQTMPTAQNINLMPLSMHNFRGPFVPYGVFPQMAHHHQPSVTFGAPIMNPFCANGLDHQKPIDVVHMQWPTSTMMYAQSYDQFRHAFFQAPCSQQQQPLSFGYSQNY